MPKKSEVITESFRGAALFLVRAVRERGLKAVMFAGSRVGAGTTTAVVHVARELRLSFGIRPLVVELNRHRPTMRGLFQLDEYKNIEAIAAGSPVSECVQVCPDGLEIIPSSGQGGDNGQPIPVDAVLRRIVDEAGSGYDIVLVDVPPVLEYPDVFVAGTVTPNLMLVVEAGSTHYEVIERIRRDLANQKITVIGAILNRHRRFLPGWLYRMITR